MFCTSCGASNLEDATFCVNCGESMREDHVEGKSLGSKRLRDTSLIKKGGFFQALFEFSFNHFFMPRIIRVLYGLSVFLAGWLAILFIFLGFRMSTWLGLLSLLIGAPLVFLLTVLSSRVCLELVMAVLRIADALTSSAKKPEPQDGIEWNV